MEWSGFIEVVGVLLGAFVFLVVVPLGLLFLFVKHRGGDAEIYRTMAALKSGTVAELLPWTSASLGELTREWVGFTTHTVSMFGRGDQSAGRVPSSRSPEGWLLALSVETKNAGADGTVRATTAAHRLELAIKGGVWTATLNGTPLGHFSAGHPPLLAPDGTPLGDFGAGGQLALRGRAVTTIATPQAPAPVRPQALTPLLSGLLEARTPEDEAWALVLAVFQLARASTE